MRYVLIHGAWHGGWCWHKVTTLLQQLGYQVDAPDLPGNDEDATPLTEVTLEAYAKRVCQVLDAHSEPSVLIGHSLGGLAISQAAELCPERVRLLVYLAGALLPTGESLLSLMTSLLPNRTSPPYLMVDQAHNATVINLEALEELYTDCETDDILYARSRLVPQSMTIYAETLRLSPERFGRIPRIYISCLDDPVIPPSLQRVMYHLTPCQTIFELQTGHFPFFSAPFQLVQILTSL